MKTSSLIITFNDLLTTGGHNLSSRISRVNSMTHYKQSKGNYVPKDYDRPANTEPVLAENKPVSAQPSANTPATNQPSGGTVPSAKPSGSATPGGGSKPSSGTAPGGNSRPTSSATPSSGTRPSTGSGTRPSTTSTSSTSRSNTSTSAASGRSTSGGGNIRPRSAVISTAPRGTRGL